MGIVEQYLLQLKKEKRRLRRTAALLIVLSLLVASGVSWNLRMTGVTIANGASCGQEEHHHTVECPIEKVKICGYDELVAETVTESPAEEIIGESSVEVTDETQQDVLSDVDINTNETTAEPSVEYPTDELTPFHMHTDECYEIKWICGLEEHFHTLSCYSYATEDIESAVIWEADLPELTDDWANDLVMIAQTQLGCRESERNYIVADDGVTKNGITRYGQWYGNPYGDWSAMFIMFCLHYANIPQEAVPCSPGVSNMMRLAQDKGVFCSPDSDMAQRGNLLFIDTDANGNADKLIIVTAYDNGNIIAFAGDWENSVAEITIPDNDPGIMGYINIQKLQENRIVTEEQDLSVSTETDFDEFFEETVSDEIISEELPSDPVISLDVQFPEEGIMHIVALITNIEEGLYTWQWQVSDDGNEPWIDIDGAIGLVCELECTEANFNRYYRLCGQKAPVMQTFALRSSETGDNSDLSEDNDIIISEPISPFSIERDSGTYTIDVFAIPIDTDGNRITGIAVTDLGSFEIDRYDGRITAESRFITDLGEYVSAYFGSETEVGVNNIASVSVNRSYSLWDGYQYTLRYRLTGSTTDVDYLTNAESNASLYLRYIPKFTVTFESEGFTSLSETVMYNELLTLTEPEWTREGYTLLGWTANGNEQHVYTFEDIVNQPVTENVTYTAKWANKVTVSFNLGEYTSELNSIEPMSIQYGSSVSPLPIPTWKYNSVSMSFDGWYLDNEFTQQVTADYRFFGDTILYAKWSNKDEGYYIYFMDFTRDGQVPLVLVTYSVTEGRTAFPYIPGNAPSGMEWDGKWYLDNTCTNAYNFSIPVSEMDEYLTGTNGRDLYLYPGMQEVCRAIFVTYGTKVDPVTVSVGGTINLDLYRPERTGFEFVGWTLKDGTPVSGVQILGETTTFYAQWNAGYVSFEAILRIENSNDTGMTQADILGTWYAKAGSQIRVKSTYSGNGDNRKGNHEVVCVLDGVEYPVYKNEIYGQTATLDDVYSTYFIYNNTLTTWTDEVNWDDIYTGGEVPYSTRPISSSGDTIINFDYMRVRSDLEFSISDNSAYMDIFKLFQNGVLTGSVTYSGTKPTATGSNVSATGVTGTNVSWTYTANRNGTNYYILHDLKYGQRIYDVYPVGGSYLTNRRSNSPFSTYDCNNTNYTSRREDLSSDFFSGSGRAAKTYQLKAEFSNNSKTALMYAIRCLEGEQADFTINNVGYKVQPQLCEVVNSKASFTAKQLLGCSKGEIANSGNSYTNLSTTSSTIGGTSVKKLFGETYWSYYDAYNDIDELSDINRAYIFYYDRLYMNLQFNFAYDSNGDGVSELAEYDNIAFGEKLVEYRYGSSDFVRNPLLDRNGYEFAGWLDSNGFVLDEEDWDSIVATGDSENNTMIFIAKWEKISNNIVEYYEDRSAIDPFESHYFDDGELIQYPTMTVYPEGWVWQEYGEGQFQRFDWDVPMYGEYGEQTIREINGEEQIVNIVRIYGTWDESHTKIVYDPNAPQGGIPGTAPIDSNEYTIWQSEVPVASRGETANTDPSMVFVGWQMDRNGIVYQPGDHVPVQWPRTMIFIAQWAKTDDVVYLNYDPNGGIPENIYPNDGGFSYKKNATAAVWNNTSTDGSPWFNRTGYAFIGWNTEPDGSGIAYVPDSFIVLNESVTTLYAQWERTSYTLSVYKVDSDSNMALTGAEFGLYRQENGIYISVQSLKTGVDGHITFLDLETDTLYKLVEEKPPDGYAIISKEIIFAIRPNGDTVSLKFYDSAGNVISSPNGASGEYIVGNKLLTVTVKNLRGYELPSTGGTGVFFNIICGVFLVSAPLIYGFSMRRKHRRRVNK